MPKEKQNHKGSSSDFFKKPYEKAEDTNKKKNLSKVKNGDAINDLHEITAADPTNTPNVLKCFMKNQRASTEAISKQFIDYDEKLQIAKTTLAEKNKENDNLLKLMSHVNNQMKELQRQFKELLENHDKMEAECAQNVKKYTQLETRYDQRMTYFNNTLARQHAELISQRKVTAELVARLDETEQQRKQYLTMMQAKEIQLAEEHNKTMQMQEHITHLEQAIQEERLQLIEAEKNAQSQIQAEQAIALAKLKESAQRVAELLSRVKELEDYEKRNIELQKLNEQLSVEASSVSQHLEIQKEQKLKLEELLKQNQDLKTDEKVYQTEIKALKEANEQLAAKKALDDAAAQNELSKRDCQLAELMQQIEEVQQNHLNTKNTLSAAKDELTQRLQDLKPLYEGKLSTLQQELKQKNADIEAMQKQYAELDRQSNATISELKYKLTSIGKHINQPVRTASAINRHETNDTSNVSLPEAVLMIREEQPTTSQNVNEHLNDVNENGISTAIMAKPNIPPVNKQRKPSKRQIPKITYTSDFATDEDTEEEWQPKYSSFMKKTLNGNGNAKRVRTSPDDAFDELKKT